MSEAILKFKLPEEEADMKLALDGCSWALVALDMDNWLRSQIKYRELSSEVEDAYQLSRDQLRQYLDDRGVSLEDIP